LTVIRQEVLMGVPERMRRVVVAPSSIEVVESPTPEPMSGEVLVHSVVSGVCGSDTHAAHGRHPFIELPYYPGHEVVGVVAALGPEVAGIEVGQRVTVEPDLPCWVCKQCRCGKPNLCENLRFFGCGYDQGGMADYFTIPANRLHVIPDELDYRAAALIEPMSTPVHAVRIVGGVRDKAVVILGAGTIGLLVLAVVRAHGAKRVVVTDPLPAKRERAARLGADAVLDATADDLVVQARSALGESADVVFDCVAVTVTVGQAVEMASKGGTVVIVGVPADDVNVPLPIVQDHQIRIQGSATYLSEDYDESIRLLVEGRVRVGDIVTAEVPLTRAADAYALSSGGQHIKVLVAVDEQLLA
jgi:2-desacetyl-2-hydroxyethyl bacteriochlorophyllide A dehydrogenase